MATIKTLHGEKAVPELISLRRKVRCCWLPFPALKARLIGDPERFFRIIEEIVGLKLGGSLEMPETRLQPDRNSFHDTLKSFARQKRFSRLMRRDKYGKFKRLRKIA